MNKQPLSPASIIIIAVAILVTAGFLVWQNHQVALQIVAPSFSPPLHTPNATVNVSPRPVDTSGWETYRDEKYGVEVKYPAPEWMIYDGMDGSFSIINSSKDRASHIWFRFDDPQSLKKWYGVTIENLDDVRKNLNKIVGGDLQIIEMESFGGLPVLRCRYYSEFGSSWEERYMVWHRDMLYTLLYPIDPKTKVVLEPLIPQILSTFKFIK